MTEYSGDLNHRAMRPADELAAMAAELGCAVHDVGGARVIDAGVKQVGSIHAGLVMARMCMADLGTVALGPSDGSLIGQAGTRGPATTTGLPQIIVNVSLPIAACMASQYAGWQISIEQYFAMGSGPMRAAWGKEDLFDDIGYRQNPTCAVGVLESGDLPDEAVVTYLADACRIDPKRLILAVARTASLAGGVQIVARSVETTLHKLHELEFDLSRVVGGFGQAPLPPVAQNDLTAIGRTNDAMLYGARCTLYVEGDDASLADIVDRLPSRASKDYGLGFADIFKRYGHDFYKIDPMLFSPAAVSLQNIDTGKTHAAGMMNDEILSKSFFG